MKVAIAHDYLNQYGGAERVLEAILEIFPEAPVYTLLYDQDKTLGRFQKRQIHASFLDRFSLIKNHHRPFIPLFPLAQSRWGGMNLGEQFDLIISSSAGFAKGISYSSGFHICYCHTPLRYAWEEDYLDGYPLFKNRLARIFAKPALAGLRRWDRQKAQKVNLFLANSRFIAGKIEKYYGREAIVLHPPVDTEKFYYEVKDQGSRIKDYYLMIGRFLHYKRFDLGIAAFNGLRMPLKIAGAGPELEKLKKMAESPLIEFLPFVSGAAELRRLYNGAEALIFPQVEDFGLVAAEAQACGLPVIAYRAGGAEEIVVDGKTGVFFDHQDPMSLADAVMKLPRYKFSRSAISKTAQRFSKENFQKRFSEILKTQGFSLS